jgi:[ribosomal protein S5]-alanine N-acetyltransferase
MFISLCCVYLQKNAVLKSFAGWNFEYTMKEKYPAIELSGKKIILSRLGEEHIPDMFEYSKNPLFYRYMGLKAHENIEDTRQYFSKLMTYVREGAMYWAVIEKKSKKMIGSVGVRKIEEQTKRAEVGFGISPDFWYNGISFEMLFLVSNYCFNELEFNELWANTFYNNKNALGLMEALNFQKVELVKDFYHRWDGALFDAWYLILNKEDFNKSERIKNLKRKLLHD